MAIRRKDELTAEEIRLEESRRRNRHWKRWGPYLSERQWGTVREDYSPNGKPWRYFPFEHSRSRAYRWGEDGIGGISDRHQLICFALTLWNGRDTILKERLFGLSSEQGNHGEDLKEYCFYLDSTPTHSYMKFLYKYPQKPFPYDLLLDENRLRKKDEPEFELMDTGIFDEDRYFDVFIEYAKASPEDNLIRITAHNRGPEPAEVHLLPTIWYRNTWSWGQPVTKPSLSKLSPQPDAVIFQLEEPYYHKRWLTCLGNPIQIFTENETNFELLYRTSQPNSLCKRRLS